MNSVSKDSEKLAYKFFMQIKLLLINICFPKPFVMEIFSYIANVKSHVENGVNQQCIARKEKYKILRCLTEQPEELQGFLGGKIIYLFIYCTEGQN